MSGHQTYPRGGEGGTVAKVASSGCLSGEFSVHSAEMVGLLCGKAVPFLTPSELAGRSPLRVLRSYPKSEQRGRPGCLFSPGESWGAPLLGWLSDVQGDTVWVITAREP